MQNKWKSIFYKLVPALGLVLVVTFYWITASSDFKLVDFEEQRDTATLIRWVDVDRYWLSNDPEFSIEFLIKHRGPKSDPRYLGKEKIVMLFAKDQPAGFGAYYMKNFYVGKIHLLCVDRNYRGHGYAADLMRHMIKQLFGQGAKLIKLCTREYNHPARALYLKLGFTTNGIADEQGFVHFELKRRQA